jgi:ABC-type antimicrobial peptide transport system permease subunit
MGFALIISMMIASSGVISGFSAQIFGITEKAGGSPSIFIQTKNPSVGLHPELLTIINHTNIEQVLPIAERNRTVSSRKGVFNLLVVGVNISEFMEYYFKADVYFGRFPKSNASVTECLIGKDLQPIIGSSEINLTDDLIGTRQQLSIIGLVQNVKEFQSAIIVEITDYPKIFNQNLTHYLYQRIKIRLKNSRFVDETLTFLTTLLKDYLPSLTIKPEQQADIFTASLFSDILYQLTILFGVFFIIALIRIFHAVSWFVRNYERDLLIMKSMGMSTSQMIFLIVVLAGIIGNTGFFIGLFFGILIPPLIFTILTLFFSISFIIPDFVIATILALLILSNLVILLAVLYPVIIITRKKPSNLSLSTHGIER